MNPPHAHHRFALPSSFKSTRILATLSEHFTLRPTPVRRVRLRYYDTFDWRVYRHGFALARDVDEFRLHRLSDDAALEAARVPGEPVLWDDFPEGPLRERLRDILGERALQVVGEVGLKVRDIAVLNTDDKTVARARLEEGRPSGRANGTASIRAVNVIPVRGYEKEARRVARRLEHSGLEAVGRTTFETAVEASGRKPGDYTSKFGLTLGPSMTAQQAAREIFKQLLDTMERNVDGVRADVDTEFLHDFRVAVRRTRTGLALMKDVLPSAVSDTYGGRFAELGTATNRLRDLDVYLLGCGEYRAMVGEDLRDGLDAMFEQLAQERIQEHGRLVRLLGSVAFRELTEAWRAKLDAFGTVALEAPRAGVPVDRASRRFISKRYRKVMSAGSIITDDSPDEALHGLRIECKKLRYLLEFYASLYPPDTIAAFVKQLKRLQDNLGAFNDLSVFKDDLHAFLHETSRKISGVTAAAIGALLANVEHRQRDVRREFEEAFASFSAPRNARTFAKLFG